MARPFKVGDHMIGIGTSAGTALAPDDSLDADALFKTADEALCEKKTEKRQHRPEHETRLRA